VGDLAGTYGFSRAGERSTAASHGALDVVDGAGGDHASAFPFKQARRFTTVGAPEYPRHSRQEGPPTDFCQLLLQLYGSFGEPIELLFHPLVRATSHRV